LEKGIRYHSVDYVRKEIEDVTDLGFGAISIVDDEFFSNPERDKEIITILKKKRVLWGCQTRVALVLKNKKLIEYAAKDSQIMVGLGVESGDDKILKTIEKGATARQAEEAINFLHDLGVEVYYGLLVGSPGESEETLKNTWRFCERVEGKARLLSVSILQVYPKTKIWSHPDQYDLRWVPSYHAYSGSFTPIWDTPHISTSSLGFTEIYGWAVKFEERFKQKE